MHTEYHKWWSPSLRQDMELKVYGHGGKPVLVFPTFSGRFFDFEDRGMLETVATWIDSGRIILFAVDSIDAQSWLNEATPPAERNRRHDEFDRYVVSEVVPLAQSFPVSHLGCLAIGCSTGAYHAVNFFFRHPDVFDAVIGLSGIYRLDRPEMHCGPGDLTDVYFNSPLTYLPTLDDPWFLDRYRRSQIAICCGQGVWEGPSVEDALELRRVLGSKGIPCWVDLWGRDVAHDWHWWKKQLPYFMEKMRL